MLTIGLPGFLAFVFYSIIWGLFRAVFAGHMSGNAFGRALAVTR